MSGIFQAVQLKPREGHLPARLDVPNQYREEGNFFSSGGGSAEPEGESPVTGFVKQWDRRR